MGGPLSDYSGSVSLLEGLTAAEARELIATDPFVVNGVFVIDSVRDWTVYVDELSAKETAQLLSRSCGCFLPPNMPFTQPRRRCFVRSTTSASPS